MRRSVVSSFFSAWSVTLAGLALSPAAWAAGPEVHGTLRRVEGMRVLRVWGTPTERGYAHGYLLADDILVLLDKGLLCEVVSGGPQGYEARILPGLRLMKIDARYEAELRGMLAGMEARLGGSVPLRSLGRSLRYEDLLAANCIPDFTRFGCSSFAAWGPMTVDGHTLAARNLDWLRLDALSHGQLVLVQAHEVGSDALGWASVTWPGFIGCLTGMNAEGVTVSMHDVRAGPPSLKAGFVPRAFALRDAIEAAHAASARTDIERVLRGRTVAVGNNVPVAVPHQKGRPASFVFEYDGSLEKSRGVTVRTGEPTAAPAFQICTNHYRHRDKASRCGRYSEIDRRLISLADKHETLDVAGAWAILRSVGRPTAEVPRLMTYHSVVFEPDALRMHVAFSRDGRPAPACKPVTLDVARWISAKAVAATTD